MLWCDDDDENKGDNNERIDKWIIYRAVLVSVTFDVVSGDGIKSVVADDRGWWQQLTQRSILMTRQVEEERKDDRISVKFDYI